MMKNPFTGISSNQLYGIIAISIAAVILGIWLSFRTFAPLASSTENFTLYSPSVDIAPFELTDSNDRPFTNMSLQGHWTFLFFGFTNCQSICPTTMTLLNNVYQSLYQDKQNPMPEVVMITIDPEYDTSSRMHDYVTSFNTHFQGVTGTKQQIEQLAANLNVVYTKVKTTNGYTFDHSGTLMLIDPSGRLIGLFTQPLDAQSVAENFKNVVSSSG